MNTEGFQHRWLQENAACAKGTIWASEFETLDEAWDACQDDTWMIWALRRLGVFDYAGRCTLTAAVLRAFDQGSPALLKALDASDAEDVAGLHVMANTELEIEATSCPLNPQRVIDELIPDGEASEVEKVCDVIRSVHPHPVWEV